MMKPRRRAHTIASVGIAALIISGCTVSGESEQIEEPVFEPVEETSETATTTATTSSTSESSSTSSSESEESSTESSSSRSASSDSSPNPALDNGDGTFMVTNQPPGGGAAESVTGRYRGLPDQGFETLHVTLGDRYMNGYLQYLRDPDYNELQINLQSTDLAGNNLHSKCNVDVTFFDAEGNPFPKGAVENSYYRSTCSSGFTADIVATGDLLAEISISQPGFEPFIIRQPIKAFD